MVKYFNIRGYKFRHDYDELPNTTFEIVKYIFAGGRHIGHGIPTHQYIIPQGCIDIVSHFEKQGLRFQPCHFNTAILSGNVNVAKYLKSKLSNIDPKSLESWFPVCDYRKNPEVLKYCYELICQGYNYISMAASFAIKSEDIEFIKWLNNDKKTKYGYTSPSKYIPEYKNFIKLIDDENLLISAIRDGHTDLVKYLLEQGCSYSSHWDDTSYHLLNFFLENKYELHPNIINSTAYYGSLDKMMLLLSYAVPYKLDGLLGRACVNSLDMAVFVESLGGNFKEFDMSNYILPLEKLKWINGHDVVYNGKFYKGCKTPITTNNNIQLYLDQGGYDQVKFLLSLGISTDDLTFDLVFGYNADARSFEIFKLLLRSGYILRKDTLLYLINEYPKHEINIWLYDNYPKLFDDF
jgi:hypothetical protein